MSALPGVHAQALREAVARAVDGFPVYLDEVPKDPPYPYVVVESDAPSLTGEALGRLHEIGTFHPSVMVAARSARSVREVRDRLESLWDAGVPVSGRLTEVERLSSGTTINRDDDLVIPVYWCRDILELRSYAD